MFNRVKVSKEQIEIFTKERAKSQNKKLSWADMANILNRCGPCIKNHFKWKKVNMEQYILLNVNCKFYLKVFYRLPKKVKRKKKKWYCTEPGEKS